MGELIPLDVAWATVIHGWANRFRRSLKGSAGRTGNGHPEETIRLPESIPRIPVVQTPVPEAMSFHAVCAG